MNISNPSRPAPRCPDRGFYGGFIRRIPMDRRVADHRPNWSLFLSLFSFRSIEQRSRDLLSPTRSLRNFPSLRANFITYYGRKHACTRNELNRFDRREEEEGDDGG